MADIEFTLEDGIGTITLNRPERMNAFTYDMIDLWADRLEDWSRNPEVAVIVLTGTGRAFCAGGDLRKMGERKAESAWQRKNSLTSRIHRIPKILEDTDKPVIAAINGVAVGAGLDMALMCDLRFAAQSARMGETYIKAGLVPGDGGAWYLPRLVGQAKALELFWTGDLIGAEEAERIGMINRAVPDEELMDYTRAFARRLAAMPPVTLALTKRAVVQGLKTDLRTALDSVSSAFGVVTTTLDQKEAVAAFNEKRPPVFRGE